MIVLHRLQALTPMWRIAAGVLRAVSARNLDLISAGVAFYAMLAIFPAVAALIALWGFLSDPAVIEAQVATLDGFIPEEAYGVLSRQVSALVQTNTSTLGWATLISTSAALWSTRTGVGALLRGLNAAFGTEPRAGFGHTIWAIVMTVTLICVALFALASIVVAPVALSFFQLGAQTDVALRFVRWSVTILVILGVLGLMYRHGPNHTGPRPAWISAGAILAIVIWAAGSAGFTLYLGNFGNYNEVYGSIGAVIALLMWFFLSAYCVLIGAALNAEISRQDRSKTG